MPASSATQIILSKFRDARLAANVSQAQLEASLFLGPGWLARFESGQSIPSIDLLLSMASLIGVSPETLFSNIDLSQNRTNALRDFYATKDGNDLLVHFRYAEYEASYRMTNADLRQFESVIQTLRDDLSQLHHPLGSSAEQGIKTNAVANTFLHAARTWQSANPSDIWWFVVYRAYCDPFNHPARFARLDFSQSWKRTAGWALEQVLVRHYGPFLARHGVRILIETGPRKIELINQFNVGERLEADKVDVLLTTVDGRDERCFGIVNVKASFAERRTDDVPMSQVLIQHGYTSILWTMDCKSMPAAKPVNKGELGIAHGKKRSAKRKDIEDDGYFSGCFSYNFNTVPTPSSINAAANIQVCGFGNPDDAFSRFIVSEKQRFGR